MRNDDVDKHNPEAGSGDSPLVGYVLNIMWEVSFFFFVVQELKLFLGLLIFWFLHHTWLGARGSAVG